MRSLFQLALLGALAVPLTAGLSVAGGSVALRAGTVHTLGGNTYTGGATVLVVDGKVVAVGKDVQVPGGVRMVDYGVVQLAARFRSHGRHFGACRRRL